MAAEVSNNRELIQRATRSFLAKELRAQSNKEGVAKKAIEHLAESSDPPDSKPATPDDDWLNVFERYAENAPNNGVDAIILSIVYHFFSFSVGPDELRRVLRR